jgi:hypothetical protein
MIDKKTFKKAIAAPLERAGFKKKGQSWFLDGNDALIVINLEKIDIFSNDQYVINIGIWLKAFGESVFPPYNRTHLYYRVERLFPQQRELILTGCSLEKSSPQKLADLTEFIDSRLIPFLRECTDEGKLRELMSKGMLEGGLVRIEARMYLTGN